jgi:hypothetical protein
MSTACPPGGPDRLLTPRRLADLTLRSHARAVFPHPAVHRALRRGQAGVRRGDRLGDHGGRRNRLSPAEGTGPGAVPPDPPAAGPAASPLPPSEHSATARGTTGPGTPRRRARSRPAGPADLRTCRRPSTVRLGRPPGVGPAAQRPSGPAAQRPSGPWSGGTAVPSQVVAHRTGVPDRLRITTSSPRPIRPRAIRCPGAPDQPAMTTFIGSRRWRVHRRPGPPSTGGPSRPPARHA